MKTYSWATNFMKIQIESDTTEVTEHSTAIKRVIPYIKKKKEERNMKENSLYMHNVLLFLVRLHVLCNTIRQ